MAPAPAGVESPLLSYPVLVRVSSSSYRGCGCFVVASLLALLITLGLLFTFPQSTSTSTSINESGPNLKAPISNSEVQSENGVVAADNWKCSEIGASILRMGGSAVDATVAAALCSGVLHPMASGIGGGAFIIVWSSKDSKAEAFDCRETAPLAASKDMYEKDPVTKYTGALSMAIPGEVAGLHAAWSKYGRLPWRTLFQPSIKLARDGFMVEPYLAGTFKDYEDKIMADPGLRSVFAPNGKLLQLNDICSNPELARTLETIAAEGAHVLYNGRIGKNLIKDVRNAGGVATIEDMRNYRVRITEAISANIMGHSVLGMPPPSSGTVGMSLVLNILASYKTLDAVRGLLGLHRLIEAVKHMFAYRMDLGDPDFVNITNSIDDMLSPSFAEKVKKRILDNTTFDPSYYLAKWSELNDHGTTHVSVVDADRNAVSMTSTVNHYFGGGLLSSSTGIIINNEMGDFSTLTDVPPDLPPQEATADLPPAPSNFIAPNKRPLSSMTPLIVTKDNQLAGVIGASGGINIVPALLQVFINHFILGMEPLEAVEYPRFYHTLIPNEVRYENWTTLNGEHIVFSEAAKEFLKQRNHKLRTISGATAVCQFIVHKLREPDLNVRMGKELDEGARNGVYRGLLTGISDPRKDGKPAGI